MPAITDANGHVVSVTPDGRMMVDTGGQITITNFTAAYSSVSSVGNSNWELDAIA